MVAKRNDLPLTPASCRRAARRPPGAGTDGLETAGALLREVARLHVRAQREEVACCGTTVAQCQILTELDRSGPMPLTDLARRLGVHKGWASRAVATLVREGFLERGGRDGDGRVVVLSLSRAGRRRVDALKASLNRHAARILGRIPARERERVYVALSMLRSALRTELAIVDSVAASGGSPGSERQ